LVGPSTYLHDFDPLKYPAEDVKALAAEFRASGFDEVVVLTDTPEGKNPATRQNILDSLEKLVKKQPKEENNVRQGDVVVVVLSGHGIEIEVDDPNKKGEKRWDAFFVPVNGRKADPKTLVNLGHLVNDVLAECGGRNLLLVDACRELYQPNKGKGVGAGSVTLAGQSAILFSCSAKEQSWEAETVKHGVFTHAVLEVIADAKKAGKPLNWSGLVARVEEKMGEDAFKKLIPEGKTQTPVLAAGQVPATELFAARAGGDIARDEPKVGEERSVEIADGVKMVFCYIPSGEAQLGSPKAERDLVLKAISETKEPEWLASEAEGTRGKYKSKGFWLGKFEVTQEEWTAVMGENPSYFDGKTDNKAKGLDTKRFPVEQVSWDDCQKFLEKVNGRGGVAKAFGKAGRFRLPHEDEWEYAYRAGKGNG
ncbi:MAG: caspase family protein, partial [Gemmataceae bacterium]|nr:caspase family protein [Gemmataceae bacterium]